MARAGHTAERAHAPTPAPVATSSDIAAQTPDIGNQTLQAMLAGGLRPRLRIGGADDPEEREADNLAKSAMGSGRAPATPCHCGGFCPKCAGGNILRRKATSGDAPLRGVPRPFVGAGRNMDLATRGHFEHGFGTTLQHVRLHHDAHSAGVADRIGARAYAVGNHIGFASGEYSPGTLRGRALLAHELAHVALGHGGVRRKRDESGRIVAPEEKKEPPREDIAARPMGPMVYFRGVPVADDADFMRGQMRRLIALVGLDRADAWAEKFEKGDPGRPTALPIMAHTRAFSGNYRVRSPLDAQKDMRDEKIVADARETVLAAYKEVRADATGFIIGFEAAAIAITSDILNASEAKARAEQLRYGLQRTETITWRRQKQGDGGYVPIMDVKVSHSMENQPPGQALAGAAKDLLAKRGEISDLRRRQSALKKTRCHRGECYEYMSPGNTAEYARLGKEADTRQRELDILNGIYQERYPILGRLSNDQSALKALSKGPSASAAEVLNDQVGSTLENIKDVRANLYPGGKVNVWKLPDIMTLTHASFAGKSPPSQEAMRNRVIADKIAQVKADASFREKVLMALTIGLAILAAIPSGGSSLVAGASIVAGIGAFTLSAVQAAHSLDKYLIEKAMSGTDFDKARAISASEPSLFWVAVEIVGAIADLGPAVRGARMVLQAGRTAFSSVAGATRRYLASGTHSAEALADLRRAAEAAESASGVPGMASRLVGATERVAKSGGGAEKVLGKAAGHEAKAVAKSVKELEKGAGKAVGQAPTRLGGHTVSILPDGRVIRCSLPFCGIVQAEFAVELGRRHDLAERWFKLRDRAAAAAAKGDKAAADAVAKDIAALSDELEAVRRTTEIRIYRGVEPGSIDDMFLMDKRLVVDMEFIGKGKGGRNAAGWVRDADTYWQEILRRHPEAFSAENLRRIRGDPPLAGPVAPINDATFRSVFTQYDVKGMRSKPMVHHHIGGGGQAAAVPTPMHEGFGGIHNVEKQAGIWGSEDEIAEVLQRLLDKAPPS